MNGIGKITKGVSVAIACALLMAYSSPVLDPVKVNPEVEETTPAQVEEIMFDETCPSCKYITVYDENDNLVFDKVIRNSEEIDANLQSILDKSYYLMSNSITDFYILSK